jgi:hypothetical protein
LEIGFILPSSFRPMKHELSMQNNTTGVSGGTLKNCDSVFVLFFRLMMPYTFPYLMAVILA